MRDFLIILLILMQFSGAEIEAAAMNPLAELKMAMGYNATVPFYVITVTRTGNNPLSNLDICFLKIMLKFIIDGNIPPSEDVKRRLQIADQEIREGVQRSVLAGDLPDPAILPETKIHLTPDLKRTYPLLPHMFPDINIYRHLTNLNSKIEKCLQTCRKIQWYLHQPPQERHTLPQIRNKPGIVTFNESFFQGTSGRGNGNTDVMSLAEADKLGKELSLIAPNMLWAVNTTNISPYEVTDNEREMRLEFSTYSKTERCILDSNTDTITEIKKWLALAGDPRYTLRNQTNVWYQEGVIAQYLKSTYLRENDELLANNLALYKFGNFQTAATARHNVGSSFVQAFHLLICRDLSYLTTYPELNRLFQRNITVRLVQSNTIMNNTILSGLTSVLHTLGATTATAEYDQAQPADRRLPKYLVHNDTGKIYQAELATTNVKTSEPILFPTMYSLNRYTDGFPLG
jgi:hypothetical protein